MTREEAINKIRQWSLPKETRDILEALAPELRENEDENLKNKGGYYKAGKFWKASTLWNATRNKVPQRVSNIYNILRECTWNIRSLQDFAKEVKNVQEASLDYPIILDMNGNILDGAHRVVKAYLEGKDIDIVYLGDDEWPEPDYDEEKAVRESDDERIKKSLIKFLTDIKEISESGRTTWAVRKEDAEMCKSFLAWLEKQKEKLGDISTILLVKKEIERRIEIWQKSRKELIAMECNTLADDAAVRIEELYSLISFLGTIRCNTNEKQKEQKPVEKQDYSGLNDLERAIHRGFLSAGVENVPVTIIKDTAKECLAQMDPAEWCDEDEKMLKWLCRIIHSRVVNKELSLAEESELGKWMDKWINHEPQHEKKWSKFDEDCLRRAIWYVENPAPSVVKDTNLVLWLQTLPGRFNLQPKEEWSEEDEGELQNAIDALEFLGKKGVYRSESGYDAALQAASWLKSLSERFNLQRKVEWSDEDKKMLNHLIDKIQENWNIRMPDGHYFGISNDEKETFSSWLRCLPERFNLPPKQEWSEEDEHRRDEVIQWLREYQAKFNLKYDSLSIESIESLIDWLKSLRPSWKPSEEQMDSLRDTIANTKGYSYSIYLPELYEQLKKLV